MQRLQIPRALSGCLFDFGARPWARSESLVFNQSEVESSQFKTDRFLHRQDPHGPGVVRVTYLITLPALGEKPSVFTCR